MRLIILTFLAIIAFAGNSLLCRLALKYTSIDAASFTTIRILSGATVLWLIVQMRNGKECSAGNWPSALALFVYAAGFSFAYVSLPTGTGALLLFGAVQVTMISYGLWVGERLLRRQTVGLFVAVCGIVALFLPGLSAPSLIGSVLMIISGVAWGIYSLRGKGIDDPVRVTAGNFLRAVLLALGLSLATLPWSSIDSSGLGYAALSGALASGVGYVVWYSAMSGLKATSAATVQLCVPVIAAVGGIVFLSEPITLRFLIASTAILGGVACVIYEK